MAFAFHDIILNGIPVTYSAGRITLNGSGLAYASEAAGSVTGLTVESGDARYVNITGDETVLGVKTFTGSVVAQDGVASSGNIQISKGNPRLQFRDASAGGHSQGFDIHVDTGRFYIDDNTYNSIFFDYGSNGNNNTLKLAANQLSFYTSPSGSTPQIALLIDTGRNTRVSGNLYVSGVLIDSVGNQTIDPKNYYLISNGVTSLDWTERSVSSSDSVVSMSWEDRALLDTSEIPSLNWGLRTLSGNWLTNTTPTSSGHIINKGYLDSVTGSLGGGVGSDVVRTTGNQTISGIKKFSDTIASSLDGYESCSMDNRMLHRSDGDPVMSWDTLNLSYLWTHSSAPTDPYHIANKAYVDSNSSFTLGFGHKTINPADSTPSTSTHHYFGGICDEIPTTTQSDASVVYVPTSGILRSIVGNCFVQGTLASSEDVYLVVSVNGSDVATGTYKMTGRNNIIQSGLQSINRNLSKYDSIQMRFSGSWATNPMNVRHNLNAYITLG